MVSPSPRFSSSASAAAALPSSSSAATATTSSFRHSHSTNHHLPLFLPPSAAAAPATSSPLDTSPPPRHHLLNASHLPSTSSSHAAMQHHQQLLTINCNTTNNLDSSSPDLPSSSSSHISTTSPTCCSFAPDPPPPPAPSLLRYHSAPPSTLSSAITDHDPPPLLSNFLSQAGPRVAGFHPHYANHPGDERRHVPQKHAGFMFSRSRAADTGALHQDVSEPQGNLCSSASGEILDRNDAAESSRVGIPSAAAAAASSRLGGGAAADHYQHRPIGALQSSMLEAMDHAIASSDRQQPPPPPHHPGGCRSADFHLPVSMMRSAGHGLQHSLAQENGYSNNEGSKNMGHGASSTAGKAVGLLRHGSSPAVFLAHASSMDQGTSSGNSRSSEEGGSSFATAAVPLLQHHHHHHQQQQHYNFAAAAGFSNWEHDMAPSSSASNNNNNNNNLNHENYRKRQLRDCDGFFSPHADSQNGSALEQGGLVNHFTLGTSTSPEDIYFTDRLSADTVPCRVRAKRGCATHPRSIAERVRRTKISDRMKKLQELVPNMDKQTNIAEMLDEAVEYVKGLQHEVQRLTEAQEKCRCSCNKSQEKN